MCRSIRLEEETTLAAAADNGASNLGVPVPSITAAPVKVRLSTLAVGVKEPSVYRVGPLQPAATSSAIDRGVLLEAIAQAAVHGSAAAAPSEPMTAVAAQRRIAPTASASRASRRGPSQLLRLARPTKGGLLDNPLKFLICPKVLVQKNQS
jgi:hypothetical protein